VPDTIVELLRGRPDRPLLVCEGERISYTDAERRSATLARGLTLRAIFLEP
jgi:hypothetical protein